MQGTFHRYRPDGKLVPCVGEQAAVRGPRAEGHGLPREADRQPFLLARRLPHRLAEGRTARVLAGDARYLMAEVEAGARLEFAKPGLVVATDVSKGEVVRGLDEPVTAGLVLPAREGGRFLVGYAAPQASDDHRSGYYGDAELWARVRPLAEVSRQFTALAEALDDFPELLEPGGPLRELHAQIQTLVRARMGAGQRFELTEFVPLEANRPAELSANVFGRFVPLGDETPEAPAEDGETARVRGQQVYAAYVRAGEAFDAEVHSVPIRSDWITTTRYRLVGPTGKELADGEIPLGETQRLHVPVDVAGAHYLTVHAGEQDRAIARVVVTTPGSAELATETSPLTLFQSSITRYSYVPADAAAFRVGLRTHVRPAGLTVTSPEGRKAISGDYPSRGEIEIAVRLEEAGRVWQLRIEPGCQASLWLAGDAFPYLSVSHKQVLAPVAQ